MSFLLTLLAAFVGASAAMGSGLLLESFKRHLDRRGAAAAIAGEIGALLQMTRRRNYAQAFEDMLPQLQSGIDLRISNITGGVVHALDPIIEKHIERLGLLVTNDRLPEKITTFYTYLHGIRIDLLRLTTTEFEGKPQEKAQIIEEDLAIWRDSLLLGDDIIKSLHSIADERWSLAANLKKIVSHG